MQWVFYTILQYKQTVLIPTSPEEAYKLRRRRRRRSRSSTIYVYDYTWPLPWQTECEHLIASLNHADALPQPPRWIFQSHPFRRNDAWKKGQKKNLLSHRRNLPTRVTCFFLFTLPSSRHHTPQPTISIVDPRAVWPRTLVRSSHVNSPSSAEVKIKEEI